MIGARRAALTGMPPLVACAAAVLVVVAARAGIGLLAAGSFRVASTPGGC